MIVDFHFLRPFWLVSIIPCLILFLITKKQWSQRVDQTLCDPHLAPFVLNTQRPKRQTHRLLFLLLSSLFMAISLAGPCWQKLAVPSFQAIEPRVLLLDLSESMQQTDLSPTRLERAKFKLRDLFSQSLSSQYGLIAFTGEAFVVSPLTRDAKTIDSLLPALTSEVMPISGYNLPKALNEGVKLIKNAGYLKGQLLVLTATSPSAQTCSVAEKLAGEGFQISIMPIVNATQNDEPFQRFAKCGHGQVFNLNDRTIMLSKWDTTHIQNDYTRSERSDIPLWQDEGRWFLWPALLFLYPVFRRGWL